MDTKDAGRLGGMVRAQKLSKKRRVEIAKNAVAVREAQRRSKLQRKDLSN